MNSGKQQQASSPLSPADMVDLARYPIVDITTGAGQLFAEQCRDEYNESGLCMLPGFVLPSALRELALEANSMSDQAYFCKSTHNAYLTEHDDSLPADDVAARQEETFVGSVPYDQLDNQGCLKTLYHWNPLKDFIGFVLGKSPFYRFADPLGACSVNVFVDGGEHGWHFDESEFTVTLMLQAPETGGAFEYVPQIRGLENEKDIVAQVLDGQREHVTELPFTEGTLLIFGGRQTIHRVTRVQGQRPRLVPVLCFSEDPERVNSEAVRKLFWGRSDAQQAAGGPT